MHWAVNRDAFMQVSFNMKIVRGVMMIFKMKEEAGLFAHEKK